MRGFAQPWSQGSDPCWVLGERLGIAPHRYHGEKLVTVAFSEKVDGVTRAVGSENLSLYPLAAAVLVDDVAGFVGGVVGPAQVS